MSKSLQDKLREADGRAEPVHLADVCQCAACLAGATPISWSPSRLAFELVPDASTVAAPTYRARVEPLGWLVRTGDALAFVPDPEGRWT